ncbi:MAG TPA: acyltransferase [Kofleriaceae bacterium]|nr:acyltransferase [Kofleriaceae bacterium]
MMAAPGSPAPEAAAGGARSAFLDQIKVALTALVMAHHLAITFGASGSWYYRDPAAPDSLGLSVFTTINQAFFMGLFFFISGYFTPGSLDRKGAWRFLADRAVRLLVPVVGFGVAIAPGLEYVKRISLGRPTPSLLAYYPRRIAELGEFDPGPLWFLWALFLFNVGYVVWRAAPRRAAGATRREVTGPMLVGLAAAIAAATVLVRLRWPIGDNVLHIQIAYLPQYVAMFGAGIAAQRHRSLESLPPRLAPVAAVAALAGAGLIGGAYATATTVDQFLGHAHAPALLWAAGESLVCVGLSAGLLIAFQRAGWTTGRVGRELGAGAFAAYVLHAPIVVLLALAASQLPCPALVKLAVTAMVAIPCSLAAGIAAHRAPVLGRIL